MSTLTKMAVLPMPVVERLAKYDKDLQHITNLIDRDIKRQQILSNPNLKPMAAQMAFAINQAKLDRENNAVFGSRQLIPKESVKEQRVSHTDFSNPQAHTRGKYPSDQIPLSPEIPEIYIQEVPTKEEINTEEKIPTQEVLSPVKPTLPEDEFVDSVEIIPDKKPIDADDLGTDLETEEMDLEEAGTTNELDISLTSRERYANNRSMKKLIKDVMPQNYLTFNEAGTVLYKNEMIPNSHIDGILNYLVTPNAQYVAGAMTVLKALYRVPNFNTNMIENSQAIERFRKQFKNRWPALFTQQEVQQPSDQRGGSRLARRFVIIDKIPVDIE